MNFKSKVLFLTSLLDSLKFSDGSYVILGLTYTSLLTETDFLWEGDSCLESSRALCRGSSLPSIFESLLSFLFDMFEGCRESLRASFLGSSLKLSIDSIFISIFIWSFFEDCLCWSLLSSSLSSFDIPFLKFFPSSVFPIKLSESTFDCKSFIMVSTFSYSSCVLS